MAATAAPPRAEAPPGGTGGYGGGILNVGTATLVNTTVSGNLTGKGGGTFLGSDSIPGLGGGISSGGILTLNNCTVSGNTTAVDPVGRSYTGGGGIWGAGQITISNSTITNNGSMNGGGIDQSGTVTLRSSIVAGNYVYFQGPDIRGAVQSDGYNLIGDGRDAIVTPNPGAGPDLYGPANLDSLADNGGPTLTHLPRSNSPAIDKGKNFSASSTDQRGFARTVDLTDSTYPNAADATDIGAVELPAGAIPSPTPTATATATATATPTSTATATPTATPTATATATPTASATATATPTATPVIARNISTRARIETGDNVMIAGFIIRGTVPKKVVLRGLGPSLQDMGVGGFLGDPVLDVRASNGSLILANDNWQDDPAQASQLQNSGLAPTRNQESAMVLTLAPGAYTAILRGKNNTSGIGVVEVYDIDDAQSELANVSARSFVQLQENVMIGGFTLGPGISTNLVLRALGPSLANFGISNALADPTIDVRDANGNQIDFNDNWTDNPVKAAQVTANGLAPSNNSESAIPLTLSPGPYTAIVRGKNNGVGVALIEIYNTH